MRRLWSYILLAFTTLALMLVTFPSLMNKVDTNVDYSSGYEMFFRITEKEASDSEELTHDGLLSVADEFASRLDKSNVSAYKVKVVGEDTISVVLTQNDAESYSNLRTYLSCDGSFALASPVPGNYVEAEKFLSSSSKAYLETYNGYPCIVLPVDVDSAEYKTTLESVKHAAEENEHEYAESTTEGEGDDQKTTYSYYMYLFFNWDAEAYETAGWSESIKNTDNSAVNRFCMKFKVESDGSDQYFPDGDDNKLFSMVNLDLDGDGIPTISERETAYSRARFFINILNASSYDYNVTYMFQNLVTAAQVENLFDYKSTKTLAWNQTMVAVVVSIFVIAGVLFNFYRLPAFSIVLVSLASCFAGIFAMVLLNAEYHIMAFLGLLAVALTSIASGIIYCHKFHCEAFRGRSLKKCNSEAAKKSLLPIIDVNVTLMVVGIFSYIFGGTLLRSFAAIAVIGGLASLLLNIFALKGLNWLLANNTAFQGKYELFGVDPKLVPNTLKEEKQTYYGKFQNREFLKSSKKVTIGTILLAVIAAVGVITFSAIDGQSFNTQYSHEVSSVYFETHTDMKNTDDFVSALMKEESVSNVVNRTYVYTSDMSKAKSLSTYVDEIRIPDSYSVIDDEKVTWTYFQYVVVLKEYVKEDMNAYYLKSDDTKIEQDDEGHKDINTIITLGLEYENYDPVGTVSFKEAQVHTTAKMNIRGVKIGLFIASAILAVYYMLRYRSFARGLMTFVSTVFIVAIVNGMLTLSRLNIASIAAGSFIIVGLLTMILAVYLMNREREMKLDSRSRENALDDDALASRATSSAATAMLMLTACAGFIGLNFFGFAPVPHAPIYISIAIGGFLAYFFITRTFIPNSETFARVLKLERIKLPHRKKKNKTVKAKSAEPEEAIFIGIND